MSSTRTRGQTWRESIGPLFRSIWPLDASSLDPKISRKLVWMSLGCGDEFRDAVEAVTDFVVPYNLVSVRSSSCPATPSRRQDSFGRRRESQVVAIWLQQIQRSSGLPPDSTQHTESIQKFGGPDAIRTRDLCLRRATLYPAELRVRAVPFNHKPRRQQRRKCSVVAASSVTSGHAPVTIFELARSQNFSSKYNALCREGATASRLSIRHAIVLPRCRAPAAHQKKSRVDEPLC
jgi:hypothetical protein